MCCNDRAQRARHRHILTHTKGSVVMRCFFCFFFIGQRISSAGRQRLILRMPLHNTAADALFQEAIECCGVSVIVFLKPVSPPTQVQYGCLHCSMESTFLFSCCYNLVLFPCVSPPSVANPHFLMSTYNRCVFVHMWHTWVFVGLGGTLKQNNGFYNLGLIVLVFFIIPMSQDCILLCGHDRIERYKQSTDERL